VIVFRADAWRDHLAWQRQDAELLERLNGLIEQGRRDPFRGTGRPEPLKRDLTGWRSRRFTGEHRLVYRVRGTGEGQALEILSCGYHY